MVVASLLRSSTLFAPGNVLIVVKLDRLGRNTRDVFNLVHELEEKGDSESAPFQRLSLSIGRFSGACTENASPSLAAKKDRQDREDAGRSGTSAKVPRFRHTVSSVNLSIRCI